MTMNSIRDPHLKLLSLDQWIGIGMCVDKILWRNIEPQRQDNKQEEEEIEQHNGWSSLIYRERSDRLEDLFVRTMDLVCTVD